MRRALGRGRGVCWDLACGTGVYAETIRELGWTPIGTDLSVAQLRHAATRMPVAVADATRPVGRPGGIPAVVSVLCHTDVEDYAAVCLAAATALAAGGRFAHVGVHPCFCGAFVDRSDSEQLIITPGYWRRDRRFQTWSPHGVRARVGATHLPLGDLIATVTTVGLTIDSVIEAGEPTPRRARHPGAQTQRLIKSASLRVLILPPSARADLAICASQGAARGLDRHSR